MLTFTPSATDFVAHERPVPRLDIRLPLALGFLVLSVFAAAGFGTAAMAPLDKGVGMPGTVIVESKVKPVQHPRGGTVAEIHVADGQQVKAGDVLVTLDTSSIDEQIGALKAQADAARRQLELAQMETATFADLADRKLASKSRVLALQRQVAEVEKENAGIAARIAIAEQELERSILRAPVAGRVMDMQVFSPGVVIQPGAKVMDIVPDGDRLVIEGRLSPNQIENVKPGMPAKVWLTALSWREQRPLPARLAWVSADSMEDKRTGQPYFTARVEIDDTAAGTAEKQPILQAGMRAEILLVTGQRTLLDQLVEPIVRNINRAFRG
jgi:membrane fusion protein, protease secretion system